MSNMDVVDQNSDSDIEKEEKKKTEPIEDITGDGGVIKEIITEGMGLKPKSGSDVTVHYVGTLLDGNKFDSSRDGNSPFKFKLGAGEVIKGWDKTVETMKKGEKCKVTLKPEYAYGVKGSPPSIPPNATLVFEIELLSFLEEKDITNDGGVLKKIISEGEKWETPNYEAKCKVHLIIESSNGVVFENTTNSSPKELTIGDEGTKGLFKAIESMKKGERSIFKIKSNYAYGEEGDKGLNIPPNTDLIYEIELLDFEKGPESWQLNKFEEKYEVALRRKNDGNRFFSNNQIALATQKYEKSLDLFQYDSSLADEEKRKANEIKLTCYLNLAAVHLKKPAYKAAVDTCNKALEIDPLNIKGLWRRGVAFTGNGDWEEARRDFEKALEIDPDNKSVKTSFAQLKKKVAEEDKKDRNRFQNLFQRMAKEEEKEKKRDEKEKEKEEKEEKEK